jgi:3-keto-disaccharide hydrolase
MIRSRLLILLAVSALAALGSLGAAQEKGFTSLYNGKDLTGWHVKDGKTSSWKADGELIACVEPGGGWLTSDREYADFELHVEYRIPPGGNSGVGLRYPDQGDPAHVGMEIQILDDDSPQYKNLNPAQYTGSIYYQSPPAAKAAKPAGEWNRYEIRCQGPMITIRLNGVLIQNVDVRKFTKGEGGHLALAERPRKGHVGLQSHGDRVDFRKLEIREL